MSDRHGDHHDDERDEFAGDRADAPDIDSLKRRYRIALADFRLDRARWLGPCVAAVVDAAFLLGDPAGVATLCNDDDIAARYEIVAARVWQELCTALVASSGEAEGIISVAYSEIHDVLRTNLLFEYDDSAVDEDALATDAEFADIISSEFGVSISTTTKGENVAAGAAVFGSDVGVQIDWSRVSAMCSSIHARIGKLPWNWTLDTGE